VTTLAALAFALGFVVGAFGHLAKSPAIVAAGIALILAGIVLGTLASPVADRLGE
jgi:hypothetical protein